MKFDEETVVVTGSNGFVGRALLERLKQIEVRTVAVTRSAVELPAKRVITGTLDSLSAYAAMKAADYVVHLAGVLFSIGKDSYQSANLGTTEAVAKALKEGKTKRVLFLSHVGASEDSKNVYLRTKAQAERALMATGKEVVVFRCTHIIGSPKDPGPFARSLLARPGKKAGVMGNGQQKIAPLYVEDVVSALLSAMKGGVPGVYELAGPEQMSMDDLIRLLNRNPDLPISHTPACVARALGFFLPFLPAPFVDVILRDSVGDPKKAKSTFELELTSLRRVWK
jgi:nucleoside-diphosphate-sugar epimerase